MNSHKIHKNVHIENNISWYPILYYAIEIHVKCEVALHPATILPFVFFKPDLLEKYKKHNDLR